MEEPLFGEKKQNTKIALYVIAALLTLFVLFTVIVAIIFGIKDYEHLILAIALIFIYVILAILTKWYWDGDLDPKFKYLLIFILATVLITAIALNAYAWKKPPEPPQLPTCNGLYRFSDGVCLPSCSFGYCLDQNKEMCMNKFNCNTTSTTGPLFLHK